MNYGLLALHLANRPLLTDLLLGIILILIRLLLLLLLILLLVLFLLAYVREGACEENDALEIRSTVRLKHALHGLHAAPNTALNRTLKLAFERSSLDVEHRKPYWL